MKINRNIGTYGLGVYGTSKSNLRDYSERNDFVEEIFLDLQNTNKLVGKLIDSSKFQAAKTELKFKGSWAFARLKTALKIGTIHPRDYLGLAKDLVRVSNSLRDELEHAISNYDKHASTQDTKELSL